MRDSAAMQTLQELPLERLVPSCHVGRTGWLVSDGAGRWSLMISLVSLPLVRYTGNVLAHRESVNEAVPSNNGYTNATVEVLGALMDCTATYEMEYVEIM
ncbi:hypothetical protein VC83_03299 [Pseudogymnoascus destructans]|uniref:Uncharacterized protein n=1 Tax=Pseudogymnoascus destructans TaxID=655981 RepID=A0A177AGN9_9PEZI|nr:uncharacterized protein VC83_03299 [Pseudogymnoascus destructans]OAF60572.1 hypothetical protein VC83_03299 [Pseudogymnoascus destructans]